MSGDITLDIEDNFTIRGRGLVVIPKAFQLVTPKGIPPPFTDHVVLISPGGVCEEFAAQFLIMHFMMSSEEDGLYGRYSLVLLIPEKAEARLPAGSQIRVSESILSLMKNMVKY